MYLLNWERGELEDSRAGMCMDSARWVDDLIQFSFSSWLRVSWSEVMKRSFFLSLTHTLVCNSTWKFPIQPNPIHHTMHSVQRAGESRKKEAYRQRQQYNLTFGSTFFIWIMRLIQPNSTSIKSFLIFLSMPAWPWSVGSAQQRNCFLVTYEIYSQRLYERGIFEE
jgi:hypothetical protein